MKSYTQIRKAGAVRRYHTTETIRHQTISSHSWHVAQIVRYICPDASADLLCAALDHDVGEIYTGDIPAPFKWDHPNIAKELNSCEADFMKHVGANNGSSLTTTEHEVLKFADMLDCALWCREELMMGNQHVREIYDNAIKSLTERWCPSLQAAELLEHCMDPRSVL